MRGSKYKIAVFDLQIKTEPAQYPDFYASGIVGFEEFFIAGNIIGCAIVRRLLMQVKYFL